MKVSAASADSGPGEAISPSAGENAVAGGGLIDHDAFASQAGKLGKRPDGRVAAGTRGCFERPQSINPGRHSAERRDLEPDLRSARPRGALHPRRGDPDRRAARAHRGGQGAGLSRRHRGPPCRLSGRHAGLRHAVRHGGEGVRPRHRHRPVPHRLDHPQRHLPLSPHGRKRVVCRPATLDRRHHARPAAAAAARRLLLRRLLRGRGGVRHAGRRHRGDPSSGLASRRSPRRACRSSPTRRPSRTARSGRRSSCSARQRGCRPSRSAR